jgi:hypothetical protein
MIRIREGRPEDMAFVYSSWVKSYAGRNKDVPRRLVYGAQVEIIREVVKGCHILVATPEGADDDICGWVCYRLPVYQFMYVKAPFRRFGVAITLMKATGWDRGPIMGAYKPSRDILKKIEFEYVPQLQRLDMLERFANESVRR